jgi:cellulose synthase/poly-beta-1,6-N-acetylglucosamine synthase-like glycosyltransferase
VRFLFSLSLLGVFYTYLGYPLLIWLLARLRPRPWLWSPISPSVSIVLAVHNGAALLPRKIQHLLALDYPNIREIIIVSDGSTDSTAEVLARHQHSRLTTMILSEHSGKAVAVNAGMARATAEVILFVDIRPEIAPGSIQQLVGNFADPKVGCVAGDLILRTDNHDHTSAAVSSVYWRYENWIRNRESIFGSPVGVYGGFYAVRREAAVPLPPGVILDDMFQPLSIIRRGYRSVLDSKADVYDRWPEKIDNEFHRKVRTLAGNFQLFQLAPWMLTLQNPVLFQLLSHKVLRLLVPYLAILLLASTLALSNASPLYLTFAIVQILGWGLAFASLYCKIPLLHRVAAPAGAMLVLFAAAVAGLYQFLFTRGELWTIWTAGIPAPGSETAPTENRSSPVSTDAGNDGCRIPLKDSHS